MEAQSEYVVHIAHTFSHDLFRTICYAQTVLSNKISASELRRKLIKSALLVGYLPPHAVLA